MATIFDCPNPGITCPGTDYPVSNYSAEAPDGPLWISMRWPGGGLRISGGGLFGGGGGGGNPLGIDPNAWPCVGMSNSPVSQQAADLCSGIASDSCGTNQGDCPPPNLFPAVDPTVVDPSTPPNNLFYNSAQTCTVHCANGSAFTYSIRAGVIANRSQIIADQIAMTLVCQFANTHKVCINPAHPKTNINYDPLHLVGNTGFCCAGETLTGESMFEVTGTGVWTFSVSGQLPIGTGLSQDSDTTAGLFGTLNVPGIYNFTITADNNFGQSVSQNYTIQLIGLSASSLTSGTVGAFYTDQVVFLGVIPPVTIVPLGPLPPGLSMSPSGAIAGTPTTPGTY